MNFTLASLTASLFIYSPMMSPSIYFHSQSKLDIYKFSIRKSFSSFINSQSNFQSILIKSSSFLRFISTPLILSDNEEILKSLTISAQKDYPVTNANIKKLDVIECHFKDCTHVGNEHYRGGAIRFTKTEGHVTVYGTTFDNCYILGDGGALFICGTELNSGSTMTHKNCQYFNSSYCCYSKCSASQHSGFTDESKAGSGYGSVMLIASSTTELYYSSSLECPSTEKGQAIGAQFDLQAGDIRSNYINATTGNSKFCAGIEYRDVLKGVFQFQTIVNQKGGFITSFTKLASAVKISDCNFVNETLFKIDGANTISAVIHVRYYDLQITNFCILDIKFDPNEINVNNYRLVSTQTDHTLTITMDGCTIDDNFPRELITGLSNSNEQKFDADKHTNTIDQLNLGVCEGKKTPPPTYLTQFFSESVAFSFSQYFTKSDLFSFSNKFSESVDFTSSKSFTESLNFDYTSHFTSSHTFTKSSLFSKSSEFSSTTEFTETSGFSGTNGFSRTGGFTKSDLFSKSAVFHETSEFSESSLFSPSKMPMEAPLQIKGGGLGTPAIAGIAAGAVAAVIIIALAAFFVVRWRKNKINLEEANETADTAS